MVHKLRIEAIYHCSPTKGATMNETTVRDTINDAMNTLSGAQVLLIALADSDYVHDGACDALEALADMLESTRNALGALE